MRYLLRIALAALLAGTATSAEAAWYQASSKHFIIYADTNAKQLDAFASRLERFDQAVRTVMHYDDPAVGDGNRLTVFILPSVIAVQRMAGKQAGNILGFYQPRAEGCLAFVPRSADSETNGELDAGTVFFHEYTHHLQFENLNRPMPEWLVEGFATFMQTAAFQKDGSILLGSVPKERAWGLLSADSIPLSSLLTEGYAKLDTQERDLFYGEGWLLTHYFYMTRGRSEQLVKYLDLLDSGVARPDAAQKAFGNLKQLQHELTLYKNQSSLFGLKVGADKTQPGPIAVTPLSPGGAAVILLRAEVKMHGADKDAAAHLVDQVRAVESQHPGDELVEATLAEVELDAGDPVAGEAAANRALSANPKNVEALIYKGRAGEERAKSKRGAERLDLFDSARGFFSAANRIDTEDPEPLYEFYKSYIKEGIHPTDNAVAAMHYASDLVPQDMGLRMNSAIAYLNEGKPKDARATLTVVAYSPHGEDASDVAQRMIVDIDSGNIKSALSEFRHPPNQAQPGH